MFQRWKSVSEMEECFKVWKLYEKKSYDRRKTSLSVEVEKPLDENIVCFESDEMT